MADNDEEYWEEYWEENREEILEDRKQKYHENKAYREKIKERARKNARKNKQANTETDDVRGVNKPRFINGEQCISTGQFLQEIDEMISYPTLVRWFNNDVIPATAYYVDDGTPQGERKWIRISFVEFFKKVMDRYDDFTVLEDWGEFLHARWEFEQ